MLNIEFYSKQRRVNSDYNNKTNLENIISYFKNIEWIAVDTETTGFDPYIEELYCIQLGTENKQFVIDLNSFDIKFFKNLLESKNLILQNAKFDLRFLYKNNIFPNKVYDTYLAEVKLSQGIKNVRRNLQALENKYCNTDYIDKGDRGLINKQGFSDRVIRYCAGDVAILHKIKEEQEKIGKELQMLEAIRLENEFVLVLAYTEYCGLYLNPKLWKEKVERAITSLRDSEDKLNKYILSHNMNNYIDTQLNLFSDNKRVNINWNSDVQVKKLFKELGINITIVERGKTKESVESKVLIPQKDDFDIIPLYLNYKKYEKDVSTYGMSFLRHINPVTERIHSSFTQIVDTGRMASGGKQRKVETPNLQNIPANDTRKCFTPQLENYSLCNADYTGQEQIVLANKSKDKDLIKFYKANLGDMHSFVCSKIYPELKNTPLNEIKKKYPDKRQIAKAAGFALNYGGTGFTISRNLSISKTEGKEVENAYFDAFPGLRDYYDKCEKEALSKGYILIDSLLGSKYFIEGFEDFQELHKEYNFDNRKFWDRYKKEKKKESLWYILEKENVSKYFRWKGLIRRMALNFPIQGSSASITKLAGIYLYRWLKLNNYINKILIVNIVHDEIMTEQPDYLNEAVSEQLKYNMEKAGALYCPIIPLKAEPKIVKYWNH